MDKYLRNGFLHFLSKASPFIIPLYAAIYGFMHNNKRAYLFMIGSILSDLLNFALKWWIYPLCGEKWFPKKLLGTCDRPFKNVDCSVFGDPGKSFDTYGMPSGHAQFAVFTAVYWLFYLYKYMRFSPKVSIFATALIVFAAFVLYSRVALSKCHTTQQVIAGGVIGALAGWGYYRFSEWWLKRPVQI